MKRNILLGFLLFASSIIMANNELVIQVKTDKYANETTWKLFDTDNNIIAENGVLGKDSTHYDTISLDETNCYYWTIYDSHGDGFSHSTTYGDYQLYLNGNNIASCADPDFGDSISVYGIGTNCAINDIAVEEITIENQQAFNAFDLSFNVFNFGSAEVNSVEVVYSINGEESESFIIDTLSLGFGLRQELTIPEKVQILEPGDYSIGVEVKQVNNEQDEFEGNNYAEKSIAVANGYFQKPMHELFTANWCGPCALANPILDALLDQYPGQYSLIKYQYHEDTYFHPHGGSMANFYNVAGVPSMYVNKINTYPGTYTAEDFESNIGIITQVELSLNAHYYGDSVKVKAKISSSDDFNSPLLMRLAIVEKVTTGNIGTNGEDEFHNVFMRFLSDWRGDEIGTLNTGDIIELDYSGSMANTFVEEMDDLLVVGYLFTEEEYNIHQSEMVNVPEFIEDTTTTNLAIEIKNKLSVYPNPANDYFIISNANNAEINIYDACGKLLLNDKISEDRKRVDVSAFENGIYFVRVISQNTKQSIKIIKQ